MLHVLVPFWKELICFESLQFIEQMLNFKSLVIIFYFREAKQTNDMQKEI